MDTPCIIITLDYEIFGNGSGGVKEFLIEPTNRLIEILAARGIKMTVFFEIEEFLTFKKNARKITKEFGYDFSSAMEKQLEALLRNGHEIGLHIHPQWIGARFDGRTFRVNDRNLSLYDVFKNKNDMFSYLKSRTEALKKLSQKYNPEYDILSFRAGGLAIRPEQAVLNILGSLGIKADSSVVKDLHRVSDSANLDFRGAPRSTGYWFIRNSVCKEEKQKWKMIEFPICSKIRPEYTKLSINRIRMKFFSSGRPLAAFSQGLADMAVPRTPWGFLAHLFKKNPLKFDYCHMTGKEMLSFLTRIENSEPPGKYPLTMIGHSKEFFNGKELESFIDAVLKKQRFEFITMADGIKRIENSL